MHHISPVPALVRTPAPPVPKVSALLKRYADDHALAVVLVNQVSDDVGGAAAVARARTTAGLALRSSGRSVVPALGLSWAHCVDHRLFVGREQAAYDDREPGLGPSLRHLQASAAQRMGGGVLRQIKANKHYASRWAQRTPSTTTTVTAIHQVVFSPYLPQCGCRYVVDEAGVRGVREGEHAGAGEGDTAAMLDHMAAGYELQQQHPAYYADQAMPVASAAAGEKQPRQPLGEWGGNQQQQGRWQLNHHQQQQQQGPQQGPSQGS